MLTADDIRDFDSEAKCYRRLHTFEVYDPVSAVTWMSKTALVLGSAEDKRHNEALVVSVPEVHEGVGDHSDLSILGAAVTDRKIASICPLSNHTFGLVGTDNFGVEVFSTLEKNEDGTFRQVICKDFTPPTLNTRPLCCKSANGIAIGTDIVQYFDVETGALSTANLDPRGTLKSLQFSDDGTCGVAVDESGSYFVLDRRMEGTEQSLSFVGSNSCVAASVSHSLDTIAFLSFDNAKNHHSVLIVDRRSDAAVLSTTIIGADTLEACPPRSDDIDLKFSPHSSSVLSLSGSRNKAQVALIDLRRSQNDYFYHRHIGCTSALHHSWNPQSPDFIVSSSIGTDCSLTAWRPVLGG